MNLTYAVPTIF